MATATRAEAFSYRDHTFATESELVLRLLDEFRCAEQFAAEYLRRWIEVSDQERVRGGLRVIQQREEYHGRLLEARLRELGGVPACTPPEERQRDLPFYAAADRTDAEKLLAVAKRLRDPNALLQPLRDAVAQVQSDQETRVLLDLLVEDEVSSVQWLRGICAAVNPPAA